MTKKIYLAADHAGFELKEKIKKYLSVRLHRQARANLKNKDFIVEDLGTNSDESVDYPDFAFKLGKKVAKDLDSLGILICGTGIGMSIAANKVEGIRAAHCDNLLEAEMSRKHNNANVLCLGARIINFDLVVKIVNSFLESEFEGGRHKRRVEKIDGYGGM